MNNENLEKQVLKKKSTSKVLFVVLGLIVLGVVSLFIGIKVFSNLSISADTTLPPIPGDPIEESAVPSTQPSVQPSITYSAISSVVVSAVPSVSPTPQPPTPPDPAGPPINVTIKSGWSMMSGSVLFGYELGPVTQKGIYIYSFNDPYMANRNWIVSSPTCVNQKDFFCLTNGDSSALFPGVGYYVYNPGADSTLTLNAVSIPSLWAKKQSIFARGWHLMHWDGAATTKEQLLKSYTIHYTDKTGINLFDAVQESKHQASSKIFVVMNSQNINTSSVKELTGVDAATTVSKIPQDSYFWVYLRRTKAGATQLSSNLFSNVSDPGLQLPPLPNEPAIDQILLPPVPAQPI